MVFMRREAAFETETPIEVPRLGAYRTQIIGSETRDNGRVTNEYRFEFHTRGVARLGRGACCVRLRWDICSIKDN